MTGSVQYSSRHLAVQGCLEILGTRLAPHPVIIPVTAPTEVLSAILRAGGIPYPVDVSTVDAQMSGDSLQKALDELESAIVIFQTYGNLGVRQNLLDISKDQITICVHDNTVRLGATFESLCTFDILYSFMAYDVVHIYCKYQQQLNELKIVRDDPLGLYAGITNLKSPRGLFEFIDYKTRICDPFRDNLILPTFPVDVPVGYYPIRVKNKAKEIQVSLLEISSWYESYLPMVPLYDYPVIKERWPKSNTKFPGAESIKNDFLFLKYSSGWSGHSIQNMIDVIIEFL